MEYTYKCTHNSCDTDYFVVDVGAYDDDKFRAGIYKIATCPECNSAAKKVLNRSCPGIVYRGLGFSCTDREYETQLKTAEAIADKVYQKRGEVKTAKDKVSNDDAFWNELASREYQKEIAKGTIYSGPPTTVLPHLEAKAGGNIASSSSRVGMTATPKDRDKPIPKRKRK